MKSNRTGQAAVNRKRHLAVVVGFLTFCVVGGGVGVAAVAVFGSKQERCTKVCSSSGKRGELIPQVIYGQTSRNSPTECVCK